ICKKGRAVQRSSLSLSKKSGVICEKEYRFSQYHFLICPTRAAPGPRSVKKMCRWHIFSGGRSGCSGQPRGGNQRRRKGGYPPSALSPGAAALRKCASGTFLA